jgi:hypothetical protein
MLQAKISCFVNAGSLSGILIWKQVQNGNENDTDGVFFFCRKFIKNTWNNKYVICGKQYYAVWMRISAVNVLLNLPAFYR